MLQSLRKNIIIGFLFVTIDSGYFMILENLKSECLSEI